MDVLDRLEEHDRVARAGEALHEVALEAEVWPHVAPPRVLVRIRVGVDADHLACACGEDVGAVTLAAGEVGDAEAADALGDPLVDGQVTAVPVVLVGHVGQRSLARQLEGRDAGRLVLLDVSHGAGA